MEQNKSEFEYTYTALDAADRRRVDEIRKRYVAPEAAQDDALTRVQKLDARVTGTATAVALAVGIVGILIFGLGLTMILEWSILSWGVLVACVGAVPVLVAYPLYRAILARGKRKYGEEIVRLTDQLIGKE